MTLADLSGTQCALLALPALLNLWAIWHALRHDFPGEKEKFVWMLAAVFLPLLGGLAYVLFGLRRSRKSSCGLK